MHAIVAVNKTCFDDDADCGSGCEMKHTHAHARNERYTRVGGDGGCPAWVAATSDKGTVHVWSLESGSGGEPGKERQRSNSAASSPQMGGGDSAEKKGGRGSSPRSNPTSALSFFRGVLPRYFSSEWSFAHYRLPDASYSCVAFANPSGGRNGAGGAVEDDDGARGWAGDQDAEGYGFLQVVTGSGGFLQLRFNKKGKPGETCEQTKYTKTMKE